MLHPEVITNLDTATTVFLRYSSFHLGRQSKLSFRLDIQLGNPSIAVVYLELG